MRKPAHLWLKLLILAGCAVIIAIALYMQLPCLFRHITGVICPSCGMTRAWLCVLRLDLGSAFGYHPMFWTIPVFLLYIVYDGRLFRNLRLNNWILFGLLGAFMLCYCIRLIVFLGGNLTI